MLLGNSLRRSRKTYMVDAKHFAQWMADQDLSLFSLDRDELVAYRTHLAETVCPVNRLAHVGRRQTTVG